MVTEEILYRVLNRLEALPEGLKDHVNRTRTLAAELAHFHKVDALSCDVAMAAHDLYRHWPNSDLLKKCLRQEMPVDEIETNAPFLLHGRVASFWLNSYARCADDNVLNAVKYHTTGRVGMSDVEKIVFIADKVEPDKVSREKGLSDVLDLAFIDLDKAIVRYLSWKIGVLAKQGGLIHPLSIHTLNHLRINALG